MRSDNIEDLPFKIGSTLTQEQLPKLKQYNAHDVAQTKAFYFKTLDMIRFREELTQKYQRDFMNHNDTKIGKDYFTMKLEDAGVSSCLGLASSSRSSHGFLTGSKINQSPKPKGYSMTLQQLLAIFSLCLALAVYMDRLSPRLLILLLSLSLLISTYLVITPT